MTVTTRPDGDPEKFGSVAFYASLGKAFVTMCAVIPALFLIELIDQADHNRLFQDGGIVPRNLSRLDGILFAPFLHVSWLHVYANSVPLLLTGTFVLAGGAKRFAWVTIFIAIVSGLGVWWIAPSNSVTVGASAVIFGYIGYLFMRGIVERTWWTLAVALLVGMLYGWQISGVLPGAKDVSWQGHLFGLVAGLIAAILFRGKRPRPEPTTPQDDLPRTLDLPTL
jgi:membrane associated rhomboid family serine protease